MEGSKSSRMESKHVAEEGGQRADGKDGGSVQDSTAGSDIEGSESEDAVNRKRFPLATSLEGLRSKYQRRTRGSDPYKGGTFTSIAENLITVSKNVFVTIYDIYESKPFLELIENQQTLEDVSAQITFGISDDAFRCDVSVAEPDRWLVPQKNVGVEFGAGFCTVSLEPTAGQYGEADVFIEVEDVGGVSRHDFTLTVKQDRAGRKARARSQKGLAYRSPGARRRQKFGVEGVDGEFEERGENPAGWTSVHVCDWMLEVGLSKYAATFASREISGAALLKIKLEDLRETYQVTKPRDRKKFVALIDKLREQSEIAAYAEEQAKREQESREKLRREKEARRQLARSGAVTSKSGCSAGSKNSALVSQSSIDPWLCGHVPRVSRAECGSSDLDSYAIVFELQKLKEVHGAHLNGGAFIDLCADDGRRLLCAALSMPFQRVVGLEALEKKHKTAQRFIQRYNQRYRNRMPRDKQSQRISVLNIAPSLYAKMEEMNVALVRWTRMEDLYDAERNRFYIWSDVFRISAGMPHGSFLLATDQSSMTAPDEQSPDFTLAAARPGNSLQGWRLLDSCRHDFSWGSERVFVYRKVEQFQGDELLLLTQITDEQVAQEAELKEQEERARDEAEATTYTNTA